MNTVKNAGLQNQSTIFQSKPKRAIVRGYRASKILLDADKARESRVKSFKELVDKNADVAKIVDDMKRGKINMDDAAKKILDTIV